MSTNFNPAISQDMLEFFNSPTADYRITGGVVLDGGAIDGGVTFRFEKTGVKSTVLISELELKTENSKIWIGYRGQKFNYDVIPNLACPLAKLVARKGKIAYTEIGNVTVELEMQILRNGLIDSEVDSSDYN
jgi:hypothetical protein